MSILFNPIGPPFDFSTTGGGSGGIETIDGNTGSASGSTISLVTSGEPTLLFSATGSTVTLKTTSVTDSVAYGDSSGGALGSENCCFGFGAGHLLNSSSANNTAVGTGALNSATTGGSNTIVGSASGTGIATSIANVCVGYQSFLGAGGHNTILGAGGYNNPDTTGNYNTIIGALSGEDYAGSESSNVLISNIGVTSESNVIRIGTQGTGNAQQSTCYIAGIYNNNSSGFSSPLPVYVDSSTGQLGYGSGGGGGITTIDGNSGSVTGSTVSIKTPASNADGTAAFSGSGTAMVLNFTAGTGSIGLGASSMAGGTGTNNNTAYGDQTLVQLSSGSAYNCAFGSQAGNAVTSGGQSTFVGGLSGSNTTNGSHLIALGYQAGGSWGNADSNNIAIGHVGVSGDAHVLRIGTQGTGNAQQSTCYIAGIYNNNSSGFSSPLPVYVDSSTGQLGYGSGGGGGIATLDGDSGSATGSTVTIESLGLNGSGAWNTTDTNGTIAFIGSGATLNLATTDTNHNCGYGALAFGNLNGSGGNNAVFAYNSGTSLTTGSANSFLGAFSGTSVQTGSENIAIGAFALNTQSAAVTSGNYNLCIGVATGLNYQSSESSNIIIGYNNNGVTSESNVLRIGSNTGTGNGQLNSAFISGITGISVTGSPVIVSSSNQLGVTVSSRRYKENIRPMESVSEMIYNLHPVIYTLKSNPAAGEQIGLIAEDVYECCPYLVVLDKEGCPNSVNYHELPVLLLNEIQRLQQRIVALEAK
jgi:trimeric autotransporter adhesin